MSRLERKGRGMQARVIILGSVLLLSGCFRSTLVSFPPARQIDAIEVSDAFDENAEPLFTIKEPKRIEAIAAFLQSTQGKWDPLKSSPSAGKYRVAFKGDGIRLFLRTGDGILQMQDADWKIHFRDISEEEQRTLLALLSLDI